MAIRFDASGDYLERTTNLPTTVWTFTAWVYLTTDSGNPSTVIMVYGNGNYCYMQTNEGAGVTTQLKVGFWNGSSGWDTGYHDIGTGAWHFVAGVRNGGTIRFYYAAVGDAGVTATTAATGLTGTATPTNIRIACDDGGTTTWNGRVCYMKLWSGVELNQADIDAEYLRILPHYTDSLNGWYPTFPGATERARDYSGNAHDWTENGTLTDEQEPPVSWGASSITLPFVSTVPVSTLFRRTESDRIGSRS